jgi:hypothetical protein
MLECHVHKVSSFMSKADTGKMFYTLDTNAIKFMLCNDLGLQESLYMVNILRHDDAQHCAAALYLVLLVLLLMLMCLVIYIIYSVARAISCSGKKKVVAQRRRR